MESGERLREAEGCFDGSGGTALEPDETGHEPLSAAHQRFVRAQDVGAGGLDTHLFATAGWQADEDTHRFGGREPRTRIDLEAERRGR